MYVRKYVKIQVNGDTYYREKNVVGYYGEFLSEPLAPFEIVEEVTIEVDEILYLINRIQDVKLRSIIRHYIAYLEKIVIAKECD
ncbi:ATPase [Lysinibacillus sp. G4S2]|uniref:ATPase n=1 Tax=Lysinibacillus sp. G4S2 TaxID=3055859 RepID=UPI0025A2C0A9|nr:ATPase [Lysinibacillus sp. G4S2]MDM5246429.1 ATPase [Lysinibacillus sp. G4S2]